MRIASILVLAELIPVESTVLTKSPGSTGVGSMMPTLIRMMNSYDCPPWKLGTLYNDGCPHHLGKTNHTPLYIIRSISWRGGNHSKQSWADQLVWTRLGFSRQNHHVCKYSVLSRRIMQDFVITLIIRVMDFTIFHH